LLHQMDLQQPSPEYTMMDDHASQHHELSSAILAWWQANTHQGHCYIL